jgi:hypothetical protein
MKIAVSCVVAPCSLVEGYRRFRGTCCLIALMMEAASLINSFIAFNETYKQRKQFIAHAVRNKKTVICPVNNNGKLAF